MDVNGCGVSAIPLDLCWLLLIALHMLCPHWQAKIEGATGMKASKQKLLFKGVLSDTAQVWTHHILLHEDIGENIRRRCGDDRYNSQPAIMLALIGHR
jgi:hypothetical protein